MPLFNQEKYVIESVNSVLNQKFQNFELIICDDCSTDSSFKLVMQAAKKDARIIICSNKNEKGASGARNTALELAKGDYIAFLDSDDLWHKDKLLKQLEFMRQNNLKFSYSYCDVIDENNIFKYELKAKDNTNFYSLAIYNTIPFLTVIYEKEAFKNIRFPYLVKRNDYAFLLEIFYSRKDISGHSIRKSLAKYRSNTYGLSNGISSILFHYYNALKKSGRKDHITSIFLTFLYFVISILKKAMPSLYNFIISRI